MVRRHRACLIDVFETAIRIDDVAYLAALAEHAGVASAEFVRVFEPLAPDVTVGRLGIRQAAALALRDLGLATDAAALDGFVAADRRALRAAVTVPDDTVRVLAELRTRGVRTAYVSNCADNTRTLLTDLELLDLVDEVVLSCEVGAAKPDEGIFLSALARLAVPPEEAVFVDDQPRFCAAARALGIPSIVLDRSAGDTLDVLLDRC